MFISGKLNTKLDINNRIVFLGHSNYPSFLMRGMQVAQELGVPYIENKEEAYGLRNCILVIIKHFDCDLKILKQNNNILIMDVIDIFCRDIYINRFKPLIPLFSGIIVPNEPSKEEVIKLGFKGPIQIIHHHWDPRLESMSFDKKETEKLSVGYFGDFGSIQNGLENAYELAVEGVRIIDSQCGKDVTEEFLRTKKSTVYPLDVNGFNNIASMTINCQISIRKSNDVNFNFKPGVKLATVAASGMNFITTRDISTMEILPDDYPYLLNSHSLNDIKKMIQFASKTYGTKVWHRGIQTMKMVKEETSLNRLSKKYIELFSRYKEISLITPFYKEPAFISQRKVFYFVNFGGYNSITNSKELAFLKQRGWDVVLFTDSNKAKSDQIRTVYKVPLIYNDTRKTAKEYKIKAHVHLDRRYELSIYCDSKIIPKPILLDELEKVCDDYLQIGLVEHISRYCIFNEGNIIIEKEMDDPKMVTMQLNKFKSLGMSKDFGLFDSAILIRRHQKKECIDFAELWFQETISGSRRDQISLPYVLWKMRSELKIHVLSMELIFPPYCDRSFHLKNYKENVMSAKRMKKLSIRSATLGNQNITKQFQEMLQDAGNLVFYLSKEIPLNKISRIGHLFDNTSYDTLTIDFTDKKFVSPIKDNKLSESIVHY